MGIKYENPQMEALAGAIRTKSPCWLVIYPPPYAKYNAQEIKASAKAAMEAGVFTDRREMRIAKLADVMRKREFKDFRTVISDTAPRIEFGEFRIQII